MRNLFIVIFLARRYLQFTALNKRISIMSIILIIGLFLGVTALITTLSIMNGFQEDLKSMFTDNQPHLILYNIDKKKLSENYWEQVEGVFNTDISVKDKVKFNHMKFLLSVKKSSSIDPIIAYSLENFISNGFVNWSNSKIEGLIEDLDKDIYNIAIGSKLAKKKNLKLGDSVVIVSPSINQSSLAGLRKKTVSVVAIIETGDFRFDNAGVLSSNSLLVAFDANLKDGYKNLAIKLHDPETSYYWQKILNYDFVGRNIIVQDWSEDYRPFVDATQMQKMALFILLLFMIGLVACNLFGNMAIIIQSKHKDIAILRAFGLSSMSIFYIFTTLGMMISMIGVLLGVLGGWLLSENLPYIVSCIEIYFNTVLYDPNVYYGNPVFPTMLKLNDLYIVTVSSLSICFMAVVYPSYNASKLSISKILRRGGY